MTTTLFETPTASDGGLKVEHTVPAEFVARYDRWQETATKIQVASIVFLAINLLLSLYAVNATTSSNAATLEAQKQSQRIQQCVAHTAYTRQQLIGALGEVDRRADDLRYTLGVGTAIFARDGRSEHVPRWLTASRPGRDFRKLRQSIPRALLVAPSISELLFQIRRDGRSVRDLALTALRHPERFDPRLATAALQAIKTDQQALQGYANAFVTPIDPLHCQDDQPQVGPQP